MERVFRNRVLLLTGLLIGVVSAIFDCTSISSTLPCYNVHQCDSTTHSKFSVHNLSSGVSTGKSMAEVELCYDEHGVILKVFAKNQYYYPTKNAFGSCNDAIFNADVVEFFMTSPVMGNTNSMPNNNLRCYNELDVNPHNAIFESGIINPNLNHTGVQNVLIDCDQSGIVRNTEIAGNSWTMTMKVPYSVLDFPAGCPSNNLEVQTYPKQGRVYRGNIYRINELTATSKCSSSLCEYLAWSPTGCTPPAFHEPTKFGYFIFV